MKEVSRGMLPGEWLQVWVHQAMGRARWTALILVLVAIPGCSLVEVRSKSKVGPEYRHKASDRTSSARWYAQQGFEFVWKDNAGRKITSGITYRRRDVDNGNGDNDNGVWLDFSFPVWRAQSQADQTSVHLQMLERRVAELENALRGQTQTRTPSHTEKE